MRSPDSFFKQEAITNKQLRNRTITSFAIFVILIFAGWMGYTWIKNQPKDEGTQKPLRTALNVNEKIFSTLFDSGKSVKEYAISAAAKKFVLTVMKACAVI